MPPFLLSPYPLPSQGAQGTYHPASVPPPGSKARVSGAARPGGVCSAPGGGRGAGQPVPAALQGGTRRGQTDAEKATTQPTCLTPSMAFLRGSVWETSPASQNWILRPREPFVMPAPGSQQSLPAAPDTPESRRRTCPTWAAAPPSPGAGAGLTGASIAKLPRTRRLQGGPETPPSPAEPGPSLGEALPSVLQLALSKGVHFVPRRGVKEEWGRQGSC